jgi:hypothetical protein
VVLIAVAAVLLPTAAGGVPLAAGSSTVPVYFALTGGGRRVPASFFGLSTEYNQLPDYEAEGPLFDRAISLIRSQDGSTMLLRIGGKSADHVFWETTPSSGFKHWSELRQPWMNELADLVRRQHLHVMLDLNLAVHSPTLEARFAQAAVKALPRGSLVGLEVGNEPDLYWRQPWLAKSSVPSTPASTPKHWPDNYSPSAYRRDWTSYARTLHARLPGMPLGGPEIISNKPPWLQSISGLGSLGPRFLTIHRYASSNCWPKTSPWWPTIPLILRDSATGGLANSVRTAVEFAHANHEALRLTEVNSISCGGNPGVADSFAIALWAPDALFEMVRAGVDSVSWHIRPQQLNAPWETSRNGIKPLPELYGLAVFAQMIRPGAEVLNATLSSSANVKGWAVATHSGTSVLLINKDARLADATLRLGTGNRLAFVRRLLAPSVGSRRGVTFGGQSIGSDARWHGRLQTEKLQGRGGEYRVAVPPYSASLIRVWR